MITKRQIANCKRYCKDSIERIPGYFEALNSEGRYDVHHVNELTLDGEFALSHEDLKRLGMYYNRPYFELIFLPKEIHRRIHITSKGRSPRYKDAYSDPEYRKRISDRRKKQVPPFLGRKHTEETRAKMRHPHNWKSK